MTMRQLSVHANHGKRNEFAQKNQEGRERERERSEREELVAELDGPTRPTNLYLARSSSTAILRRLEGGDISGSGSTASAADFWESQLPHAAASSTPAGLCGAGGLNGAIIP